MTTKEEFEAWWKRLEAGCPLTDPFELGVVKAHAEKAFYAGKRHGPYPKDLQRKPFREIAG